MNLSQQYQNSMKDAISNVLETMIFIAPTFESMRSQKREQLLPFDLEASIKISSNAELLNIFFRTTERFARLITANFIGVDEKDIALGQMADTLKEVANMAAGEFLTRLKGADWVLSVPSFRRLTAEAEKFPNPESLDIELSYEDEPMVVGFSVCEG